MTSLTTRGNPNSSRTHDLQNLPTSTIVSWTNKVCAPANMVWTPYLRLQRCQAVLAMVISLCVLLLNWENVMIMRITSLALLILAAWTTFMWSRAVKLLGTPVHIGIPQPNLQGPYTGRTARGRRYLPRPSPYQKVRRTFQETFNPSARPDPIYENVEKTLPPQATKPSDSNHPNQVTKPNIGSDAPPPAPSHLKADATNTPDTTPTIHCPACKEVGIRARLQYLDPNKYMILPIPTESPVDPHQANALRIPPSTSGTVPKLTIETDEDMKTGEIGSRPSGHSTKPNLSTTTIYPAIPPIATMTTLMYRLC